MTKTSLPTVGFDRFVDLTWAEYALDLAASDGESERLKNWLNDQIEGEVSARKTFNLLNNLWLKTFPETKQIRTVALGLAPKVSLPDRIALHWGMALANFELFQQTCSSIGNLVRLQGNFNKKQIRQRIAESYSNQGTIPRAVSRIIQSLCDWKVIEESSKSSYVLSNKYPIMDAKLLSWLFQASLNSRKGRPIPLMEVSRLPELFPFEFVENGQKLIRESPIFTVMREGLNQEYVILS